MEFYVETVDEVKSEKVLGSYPCLSDFEFKDGVIKIYDIEDLMKLSKAVNKPLIIHKDERMWSKGLPSIEIYDNYRE